MSLKTGIWRSSLQTYFIFNIKDDYSMEFTNIASLDFPGTFKPMSTGHVKLGSYGPVKEELKEIVGDNAHYNLQIDMIEYKMQINVHVHECGTKMTYWAVTNEPDTFHWIDEKALQELLQQRESVKTPSCPHVKVQPENQGKLYWLSGPPGSGKSTTCQLMAREKGYVYYEADCVMNFCNPFVDPNVENPSAAGWKQPILKDVEEDDVVAIQKGGEVWKNIQQGIMDKVDEGWTELTFIMAKDIKRQKERLGGDFAVAQAIMNRGQRDKLRAKLGPDLVFIVLNMSESCQESRLNARHGTGDDAVTQYFKKTLRQLFALYEPADEDEENAYNIDVDENMTEKDVLDKVLDLIQNIENDFLK